jgi:hypothetical protein
MQNCACFDCALSPNSTPTTSTKCLIAAVSFGSKGVRRSRVPSFD